MSLKKCFNFVAREARASLKNLFSLKTVALTCGLSVSSAMLLPFLGRAPEGDRGQPVYGPLSLGPASFPAGVPVKAVSYSRDGSIVIDGFQDVPLRAGIDIHGPSLHGGQGTVIIDAHASKCDDQYSLSSDIHAGVKVNIEDIRSILDIANPETMIVCACNPDGADAEDVSALISASNKNLRTIIMIEPKYGLGSIRRFSFLTSYDNPLGRTVGGNSNDPGFLTYLVKPGHFFAGNYPGGFIRYERMGDGWVNKGAYRGDNRYDLIDPTPIGWLRDAYNGLDRGPDEVFEELHAINNPDNTLGYWDKVARNLDKPLMTPLLVVKELGARAWQMIP